MTTRPCGTDCPTPDAEHRAPEVDWIGDWPILHGESDHSVPGTGGWNGVYHEAPDMYCLCGHPNHLMCPASDGGIQSMAITRGEQS